MSAYGWPDAMASTTMPPEDSGVPTATADVSMSTWATDKDWTKHRARIGELYSTRKLAEVMKFMESEHAFKATIKMYKRRIKQWGLDKNNKDGEMRAIVRKTKERLDQGKRSKVRVRGKAIDDGEVVRYWRRKRISIDDVITHRTASVTPEAVEVVTPVPSRVATPTSLAVPDRIFALIRDYFNGSFASGDWFPGNPRSTCHSRKAQGDSLDDLEALSDHVLTACRLFSFGHYQEAGVVLISATSKIKKILLAEHPGTLGHILQTVMHVRSHRRDEIGTAILRQFCALGEIVMGNEHPLRLICGWLASADAFYFDEILARCFRSVTDQFESFVGRLHWSTLNSRIDYISHASHARDQREELLQSLLGHCELHLGSRDERNLDIRYALAWHYNDNRQHADALRVGLDLVARTQYGEYTSNEHVFYVHGLPIIAESQYALGQTHLAEANLREAIALRVSGWGTRDSLARFLLVLLEEWLGETGQWSSAAEVREKRMGMMDPADVI